MEHSTAALRRLLSAAFSDEELTNLCFDHFFPVYERFGAGMSKAQKLQRLLEYCERQRSIGQLIELVRERNPAQFARFEARQGTPEHDAPDQP
jgi:hypothetical protein